VYKIFIFCCFFCCLFNKDKKNKNDGKSGLEKAPLLRRPVGNLQLERVFHGDARAVELWKLCILHCAGCALTYWRSSVRAHGAGSKNVPVWRYGHAQVYVASASIAATLHIRCYGLHSVSHLIAVEGLRR
jgi:hypothetical protein